MTKSEKCPCGSESSYDKCCGMFIDGGATPESPEQLMRSRYTAYTKADVDYVSKTMSGRAGAAFNEEASKEWATNSEWKGLQIIKADPVKKDDTVGHVDFVVRYKSEDCDYMLHEISEFHKEDGAWYYVDGIVNPKIGRNEVCFCGSGKKYKKCCGK